MNVRRHPPFFSFFPRFHTSTRGLICTKTTDPWVPGAMKKILGRHDNRPRDWEIEQLLFSNYKGDWKALLNYIKRYRLVPP